jgi:hypothetical protein
LTNPARNRRKERESNPQGSSLVRVRAGCRRRSACPSEYRAPAAGIEPASPRLTAGYPYQHELHRNRRVRQSGWPDSNRRSPAPEAGGLARLSYIPSRRLPTSAQRESNPHVRHGEAVGYRYIMGTFAVPGLSKIESTGWDSNPRRRLTSARSSPLDDQCLLRSGTGGARTLTEPVKSRTFCR